VRRPADEVAAEIHRLAAEYASAGRGFELREVAGGWRFYTHPDCAEIVERYVRDGQQARLTQAALETLAVVAYAGPVSRPEISRIRGVAADNPIKSLLERGLIEEAGRSDRPGNPILYRTTVRFDRVFGLEEGRHSLPLLEELGDDLPDAAEVRDRLQAMAATQAVSIEEPGATEAPMGGTPAVADVLTAEHAEPAAAPDAPA